MADPTLLRDIAIKTGVVKRLVKELCYYEKEEEKLMVKLQAIQGGDDADEHIVKKQIELLQETKQMIPECARRLMNSVENLKKVLDGEIIFFIPIMTSRLFRRKDFIRRIPLIQVISEHEAVLQDTAQYIAAAEQIKNGTEECLKVKEAARMD